ncbi:MAG: tRNA (adenosine(37)-N6)-threonylcarbamoyltransferase complex ATPase subunit type 1 TsaE [Verrucomicrobiales bacterium]|nr:tRNA (adenosine(37)-N6)-threonylcarbamoyltransferase complex ATPase subunit type 1 TsaE [Verrucomicrobiales bacterium]
MKKIAEDEAAMVELGKEIAASLRGGDVLALVGDLGAGKTHFCKGIAAGLGCPADVTSPTFSLVHEYRDGRLPVFHFDFYRLDFIEELEQIGWEEYLFEDGAILVEWADKYPDAIPEESAVWYHFRVLEDGRREVEITPCQS